MYNDQYGLATFAIDEPEREASDSPRVAHIGIDRVGDGARRLRDVGDAYLQLATTA